MIDGLIDSVWSTVATHSLDNLVFGSVSSDADLSGSWRALWDASNLYYLVEVSDDILLNDSGASWPKDDAVEIFIDADNSDHTSYDGINDFQYAFRWNDLSVILGDNSKPDATGVVFDLVATTDGYRLETAIPWTTLGVTPSVGAVIGMDVAADDDDGEGGAGPFWGDAKKAWSATTNDSWHDPSTFGTVYLAGSTGAAAAASLDEESLAVESLNQDAINQSAKMSDAASVAALGATNALAVKSSDADSLQAVNVYPAFDLLRDTGSWKGRVSLRHMAFGHIKNVFSPRSGRTFGIEAEGVTRLRGAKDGRIGPESDTVDLLAASAMSA